MNSFLSYLLVEETTSLHTRIAEFIKSNVSLFIFIFFLLVLVVIALAAFLIILYRQYKKDELVLRKYKIDPSNEDVNELMDQDKKI